MGEVLLYSILFLSGRQIPSLLGDMAYQLCNWWVTSCITGCVRVVQLVHPRLCNSANRCLGETEPALEGGHNKGPDLRRHGPSLIQTTLLGGGGVCLLKTIWSIVYLKYLL